MKTVGAIQVVQLLDAFEQIGADRAALALQAKLPWLDEGDAKARVPWRCVEQLFTRMAEQTGDALFGLRAGISTRARGLIAHFFLSAATVEEGLRGYTRFMEHGAETLSGTLEPRRDGAWFRIEIEASRTSNRPAIHEYVAGLFVRLLRDTFGGSGHVSEVRLPHAPQGPLGEYERLLAAPVRFRQPICALSFPSSTLALRIPTSNRHVSELVASEIRRERRAAGEPSLRARVERALEALVARHDRADEHEVARALGTSLRTLQRGLEQEGTSFRKTREHVLHRVGEELLCEPQPSVSEIATQLGFADVNAFGKAFRRWSGETPSAYRARSLRGEE